MQILIADDHGLFREGLRLVLSSMFENVEILEASSVEATLKQIENSTKPDLILMDLQMPGMDQSVGDGIKYKRFAGIQRVVEQVPETPLVIVSAYTNPEFIARTIEMGACGYIVKSSNRDVLKHALALVTSGEVYVPPDVLLAVSLTSKSVAKKCGKSGIPENLLQQLTPRQRATLDLVILGKSNKEIARDLSILESTVKAHIRVILKKLNASNRTEAARIAMDLGWNRSDEIPQ